MSFMICFRAAIGIVDPPLQCQRGSAYSDQRGDLPPEEGKNENKQ